MQTLATYPVYDAAYRLVQIDHPSGTVYKWEWVEADGTVMFDSKTFRNEFDALVDAAEDARASISDTQVSSEVYRSLMNSAILSGNEEV